jgi:hypothetical protein
MRIISERRNYTTSPRTLTVLPSSTANRITSPDMSNRARTLSIPAKLTNILGPLPLSMESLRSRMPKSRHSLTIFGRQEGAQTARRKRIGSAPRKNYDLAPK